MWEETMLCLLEVDEIEGNKSDGMPEEYMYLSYEAGERGAAGGWAKGG